MLALYYDIAIDEKEFERFFHNKYISSHLTSDRGKYFVLSFSFNDVSPDGDIATNFRDYINLICENFKLRYGVKNNLDFKVNTDNHLNTFGGLLKAVQRSGKQVYLIVDEYDSFANRLLLNIDTSLKDLGRAEYEATVKDKESVLRSWGNLVKTGTSGPIGRAFFTEITPIAFSDGLSSLNMVEDISSLKSFETAVGFTVADVERAFSPIYHPSTEEFTYHMKVMKDNFNGFRFSSNQTTSLLSSHMVLYYLKSLASERKSPNPLLDPNIVQPGDIVAKYLIRNYRGTDPYSILDFVYKAFDVKVSTSFRSESLFEPSSVTNALASLAFYHGFLTYSEVSGKFVSPNLNSFLLPYCSLFPRPP